MCLSFWVSFTHLHIEEIIQMLYRVPACSNILESLNPVGHLTQKTFVNEVTAL